MDKSYTMDKVVLKFIADVLYAKKILCLEELEAIYDVKDFSDLDSVFQKILGGEYNGLRRKENGLLGT